MFRIVPQYPDQNQFRKVRISNWSYRVELVASSSSAHSGNRSTKVVILLYMKSKISIKRCQTLECRSRHVRVTFRRPRNVEGSFIKNYNYLFTSLPWTVLKYQNSFCHLSILKNIRNFKTLMKFVRRVIVVKLLIFLSVTNTIFVPLLFLPDVSLPMLT